MNKSRVQTQKPRSPTTARNARLIALCGKLAQQVARARRSGKSLPPAILITSKEIERESKRPLVSERRSPKTPTDADVREAFEAVYR